MSVLLALAAAALFALGAVLQQRAALDEPRFLSPPRLLVRLVRRPLWLVGIAADTLGAVAQTVALGIGRLLVVQPLLASYLVFALPLGMLITHQRITKRSIAAATAVAAGLTGFLLLSDPGGGARNAPLLDWLIASAITIVSCTALVSVAARLRPAPKAALRGAAAGLAFALGAALIKDVVTLLEAEGLEAALADWHFYAAIAAAVATIALNQAALQAGVLAPAVTASVMLNAGGSVALGVLIFSEQLRASPGAVAGSFVSFGLMIVGVLVLAQQEEHDPRAIGAAPRTAPVTEPGSG